MLKTDNYVSGIVKDINGEPLFSVNVSVKGSTTGTITDEEGAYSFANLNPKDILVFSYLGMLSQEVTIGSRTEINIVMAEDVIGLEDVVVTGYTSMKRKDITGSVASISSEKIGRIPANDITTSLVGVPGIRMDGSSIRIRGTRSRNASNDPLIVLDGIPYNETLASINPGDIESIDVLKDGAASAIYGTRGSNGVILINLKKGTKDGQVHTTYSTSVTFNKAKKELDIMNAEEYRAYRTVSNPLSDMGADSDWFDAVTQLGVTHMHTLTFSGGNARTNYRVTADYRNARGIDLRSDRHEYGARANINHTTKDGLFTFSANITPRVIDRNKSANVYSNAIKNKIRKKANKLIQLTKQGKKVTITNASEIYRDLLEDN